MKNHGDLNEQTNKPNKQTSSYILIIFWDKFKQFHIHFFSFYKWARPAASWYSDLYFTLFSCKWHGPNAHRPQQDQWQPIPLIYIYLELEKQFEAYYQWIGLVENLPETSIIGAG
jgi:hypothetical protein